MHLGRVSNFTVITPPGQFSSCPGWRGRVLKGRRIHRYIGFDLAEPSGSQFSHYKTLKKGLLTVVFDKSILNLGQSRI